MRIEDERLPGSGVSGVVRIGDTVRRPRRPWSPTIQGLLEHYHRAGVTEVPRPLGFDEDGREVLEYVQGMAAVPPFAESIRSDESLAELGRLVRELHDASETYRPREATWPALLRDPSGRDEVVCHNDLSTYNTIYRNGHPASIIDWDYAAPGSRLWDLAYASWWLVPLHRPEYCELLGWGSVDQPRRLRLLCDSYGLGEQRAQLVATILERQRRTQEQLSAWVREGLVPDFDAGSPLVEAGRTDYVESVRDRLERALDLA
jgi:aminoglycoside phosphotransferase (APT) family kinase protein